MRALVNPLSSFGIFVALSCALAQDPNLPQPEHKFLEKLVGDFDLQIKSFAESGKPPQESTGKAKRSMLMEGRFMRESREGKMDGNEFQGIGMVGYDPLIKKFISIWTDTNSSGFYTTEGEFDKEKKTLTYSGIDFDLKTGKKRVARDVLLIESDDSQKFEMFRQLEGGKEEKILEVIYTRKK